MQVRYFDCHFTILFTGMTGGGRKKQHPNQGAIFYQHVPSSIVVQKANN